jgi:NRAMP (natural resistance-associated macrophage protein)-like metal ion transporter
MRYTGATTMAEIIKDEDLKEDAPKRVHPAKRIMQSVVGPGLVTGAADDDPSGIATYTQTGAQFGYGQLWTVLYMLPLMIAVQEACARIGAVTGKGIAAVVRDHYSKWILYPMVILIVVANTINLGADIGAMAAAARLVFPISFVIYTLLFTVIILSLEIFTTYKVYSKILRWLALALFAYPLTLLIIHLPLLTVLKATFIPHFEFTFGFLFIITAVLGTTISPYMFFWEAAQEIEEEREKGIIDEKGKAHVTKAYIKSMRIDNAVGMLVSEIATWCVVVVGAAALNAHGIMNVHTSADAAKALEPLVQTFPHAGYIAKVIFAIGIIGLGLVSVPVLSGSASYAVAEAFKWNSGLNLKFKKAHGFYGVITIATLIGLMINFIGIDPIQALVVTAVINGVVAVPLLFLVAKIASSKKIMGKYKSGWLSNTFVWLTFAAMGAAAIALFATL